MLQFLPDLGTKVGHVESIDELQRVGSHSHRVL